MPTVGAVLSAMLLVGMASATLSGCGQLAGPREAAYVQTPPSVVEAMLAMAEVGPGDYVVDLGSGDGRIPIAAARRFGARGLGIERDPRLVEQSRANAAREGVSHRVEFRAEDIFVADFSQATVVTLYLLPELNLRLRPRLLAELRPGTRIVSHDFDMADWDPDHYTFIAAPEKASGVKESRIYLWIVPARLAGHWRGTLTGPEGEESVVLELQQQFQKASAVAWMAGASWRGGGRISGGALSLDLGRPDAPDAERLRLSVRVGEDLLEGEALRSGARGVLRAARITP